MSEYLPQVDCPYQNQVNPHVGYARRHLAGWICRTGLVRGAAALARFERADFAWFAGAVHPTADAPHLALMAEWFAWLFLVDDQLDDGALGTDGTRARKMRADMRAVLDGDASGGSPALAALADLWQRTCTGASAGWRDRFAGHLDACLHTAATWEVRNRVQGIVPDEQSYVRNRRHTGAIYLCMDLIEIVERVEIPRAIYSSPEFTDALDAACNVVCWTNDVYSLEKERAVGEVHNLVYIVAWHRGWLMRSASDHVCRAIAAESARYASLEDRLLRTYPQHEAVLSPVAAGMRTWISGNNAWSRQTRRYEAAAAVELPDLYLEPTLLGEASQ